MNPRRVSLMDAGTGNLRSVEKALRAVGAEIEIVRRPEDLRPGQRILLPGVGAFASFMAGLRAAGLDRAVRQAVQRGDPLLGICVGMQALFESSEEMGECAGLGLLPGRVVRFPDLPGLKIPHTGWNSLRQTQPSPLLDGLGEEPYVYFNHSYLCQAAPEDEAAESLYGQAFASVVQRGRLYGVQFHPEKSQRVGLRILDNFLTQG